MNFIIEIPASGPGTCLPADIDRSDLYDMTRLCDSWRSFVQISTGFIINGADCYADYRREQGMP